MNCIDVHRKLTAEPNNRDTAICEHLNSCSACTKFATSIEQFDSTLHDVTNINIPDGLAERILLKQNFKQQRQAIQFKRYALAASVFLVVGVSLVLNNTLNNSLSLEVVTIDHVTDERHHLSENKNVQLAKLNTILKPFNIQFKNKIGHVNYAGSCPIRNARGAHIVLRSDDETATLLVMPGEYVTARTSFTKGEFKTLIIPTKNGSIAIITDKNAKVAIEKNIENRLNQTIQYI